jgi:hypothetical protein
MGNNGRVDPKRTPAGTSAGGQFAEDQSGATNIPTALADSQPLSPVLSKSNEETVTFTRKEFENIKASIVASTRETIWSQVKEEFEISEYEEGGPSEYDIEKIINGSARKSLEILGAASLLNIAIPNHEDEFQERIRGALKPTAEELKEEATKIGLPISEISREALERFAQMCSWHSSEDWRAIDGYNPIEVKVDEENNIHYVYDWGSRVGGRIALVIHSTPPFGIGGTPTKEKGILAPRVIDYDSPNQIIAYIDEVKAIRSIERENEIKVEQEFEL